MCVQLIRSCENTFGGVRVKWMLQVHHIVSMPEVAAAAGGNYVCACACSCLYMWVCVCVRLAVGTFEESVGGVVLAFLMPRWANASLPDLVLIIFKLSALMTCWVQLMIGCKHTYIYRYVYTSMYQQSNAYTYYMNIHKLNDIYTICMYVQL